MSEDEDRVAIRAAIENFAYAIDAGRPDLLTRTFAPGATIVIGGRQLDIGNADQLATTFTRGAGISSTTHLRTSQHIDLNGDTAHSHTLAQGIVVETDGAVHVRGVSYHDEMTRTAEGWRISHRVHEALWQFDTIGTDPFLKTLPK